MHYTMLHFRNVSFSLKYSPVHNDYFIINSQEKINYFCEIRKFKKNPDVRGIPKYFNSKNHSFPQPTKDTKINISCPDHRVKSNLWALKSCSIPLNKPLFSSGLLSKLKTILGTYRIGGG